MDVLHIRFKVSVGTDEECWSEGYMNSGNVGDLNSLLVSFSKDKFQVHGGHSLATGKSVEAEKKKLDTFDLADAMGERFDLDPSVIAEVLQIASDPESAAGDLSSEGLVVCRLGEDYCGEINLSEYEFSEVQREAMRLVFVDKELGGLNSGEFDSAAEAAFIFVPND